MLDPATIAKLESAIPALGKIHECLTAELECRSPEQTTIRPTLVIEYQELQQALAALWSWPELVEAAKLLHEVMEQKRKGRYHSCQVTLQKMTENDLKGGQ